MCNFDSTKIVPGANSYYSGLADYRVLNRLIASPTTGRGKKVYSNTFLVCAAVFMIVVQQIHENPFTVL